VLFETFCLMDDFEAHAMADKTNIPGTTTMPETIITMPVPTSKDIDYPSSELAMKDTMCWADKLTDMQRGNVTSYFEDVKRRSVEDRSAKRPDLTFY
jgi:hypothetical protein